MKEPRRRPDIVILFCLPGFFLGWNDTPAQRTATRVSAAFGYSDNVFETVSDPAGDGFCRLQGVVQVQSSQDRPFHVRFLSHSGVEMYGRHDEDNRLAANGSVRGEFRLSPRIGIGVESRHRFQHFFVVPRGYQAHTVMPYLQVRILPRLFSRFSLLGGDFDYRNGTRFDSRMKGALLFLEWQLAPRLSISAQWRRTGVDYERNTLLSLPDPPYWWETDSPQRDENSEFFLEAEWYWDALFRVGFAQETNRSNSFGFGYACPKWTILIARQLLDRWTFSLFFRLERKRYDDRLAPAFQISPDTEREENNALFLQLDRDLSSRAVLEFRGGWVRNESPFRSRYYRKSFLTIGISRTF